MSLSKCVEYDCFLYLSLIHISDNRIADKLAADGLENAKPFVTEKGTHAAVYVNSESPHYLLIENAFPNGHPALEQCGVIITRRDIVEKSAMMKVSTCTVSYTHLTNRSPHS